MIPMQYALRRRMMVSGGSRTFTVTLVGTFYITKNSYAEVVIDGVTYNSARTIEVPAGTAITINSKIPSYSASHPSTISVNGSVVASATAPSQVITYTHIVNSDCLIESNHVVPGTFREYFAITLTT